MKLLLVEDDDRLADVVRRGLGEAGHVVDRACDGVSGERMACEERYDAIILDLNLPAQDGLSALRALRSSGVATPVLVLTARDETDDVVAGLDAGADDYLRKPFVFRELQARLRSVARREAPQTPLELRVADLVYDLATRRVARGEREITLTAREHAFLEYLMRNTGRVLTRAMFESALWDRSGETGSNVVDVYVRRLRVKIDADGERPLIETVRGIGYRLGP